jgi:hypothetical protein
MRGRARGQNRANGARGKPGHPGETRAGSLRIVFFERRWGVKLLDPDLGHGKHAVDRPQLNRVTCRPRDR